jgi:hypothetical protein
MSDEKKVSSVPSRAVVRQQFLDVADGKLDPRVVAEEYTSRPRGRQSTVAPALLQELVDKMDPTYFSAEGLTQGKVSRHIAARFNTSKLANKNGWTVSEQRVNKLVDTGAVKFPVQVYRATRTRKATPAAPANNSAE